MNHDSREGGSSAPDRRNADLCRPARPGSRRRPNCHLTTPSSGASTGAGPFQIWDAAGVKETAERLEREGKPVPPVVQQLLAKGRTGFYTTADTGETTVYVWLGSEQIAPYHPSEEFLTPGVMGATAPKWAQRRRFGV